MDLPIGAASPAAEALIDLVIILAAAKVGDEIFKRIGQPAIIGEILAGLLIGPSVIGIVEPSEILDIFAELGIVFLLFWVGLESKVSDMAKVGRIAGAVGAMGIAIPFGAGLAAGMAFGESFETSMFIGAALAATSTGITSAVFAELGKLRTKVARTVLGAAVVDDVLALILLAVAVSIAESGGVNVAQISISVGLAIGFVAVFALGGTALLRKQPRLLELPKFAESPLLPAVILCLAIAALAAQVGLAAVIGAFLAGMIVAETKDHTSIEREIAPLFAFFPPFFFASIGIGVDISVFADGAVILLLLGITVLAIVTKLAGVLPAASTMGWRDGTIVGVGMVPRGEVGIVVAGIGLMTGVTDDELFAAIVGMSILTTLVVPPVLRALYAREPEPEKPARGKRRKPAAGH
ncbi:MAG: cation:proton antiporter [Solirubrobacterales bacterium]